VHPSVAKASRWLPSLRWSGGRPRSAIENVIEWPEPQYSASRRLIRAGLGCAAAL
jgi:hypothetical protein